MRRFGNKVIQNAAAVLGVEISTIHYRLNNPDHKDYEITLSTVEKFQSQYVSDRDEKMKLRQKRKDQAKIRRRQMLDSMKGSEETGEQ